MDAGDRNNLAISSKFLCISMFVLLGYIYTVIFSSRYIYIDLDFWLQNLIISAVILVGKKIREYRKKQFLSSHI